MTGISGEESSRLGRDVDLLTTDPGLCRHCVYLEIVRSKRSVFVYCARSRIDSVFRRYPTLPVIQCAGHRASAADPIET